MPSPFSTLHDAAVACPSATPLARGPRKDGQLGDGAGGAAPTPAAMNSEIAREQDRLRQNLQVLTDSQAEKALKETYVQKFENQERILEANRDRAKKLGEEIAGIDQKVTALMNEL
jgi:hypothetical protein